jgi:SWI/SNF-related matrix-associated actin-dependent regulator 1 of chromatin subfamily A
MTHCNSCKKLQSIAETKVVYGKSLHKLACGHLVPVLNITQATPIIEEPIIEEIIPDNWRKAYAYQRDGVLWDEANGIRCLIADEPGLGKTVQALLLLDRNYVKLTPTLIIVPAALTLQWYRFCNTWLSSHNLKVKPIMHVGEGFEIMPDENIVIISSALIAHPKTLKSIKEYGFKCIIADESHHFKSEKASRTQAFVEICEAIEHVILLSGTPLVNNVMEYYTTLKVLNNSHWYNRYNLARLCDTDSKGKLLGIREYNRQWFFERISKYVIRRQKKDHLKDLPSFRRDKTFLNSDDKLYVKTYNMYADLIEDCITKNDFSQVIGILAKIRHITGLVKIKAVYEKVIELIEGTDGKICIGVHHQSVATRLIDMLTAYANEVGDDSLIPLSMNSSQSVFEKQAVEDKFRNEKRILVASILATAEGRNMQFCNQVIIAEREWNPAKEEQFEQRFWRNGQTLPVTAEYFMVKNTLDEWLDEIVDMKREVVNSGADENIAINYDLMRVLAGRITNTRLRVAGV